MVTLYLRVTMRRSTGFSALFSLLKSASAGAFVLATILSCSDSTSPTQGLDGVIRVQVASVDIVVPDSLKQALSAQFAATLMRAPIGISANVLSSPAVSSSVASLAGCGSGGAFAGYTESRVPFAPETIPNIAPYPLKDDGYIPDSFVPLGFSFTFHGNTYDKVNVFSNGFLLFGAVPTIPSDGFYRGGVIPSSANPNNVIAFGWTDWSPQLVQDGIRYETRGTAPNRRFILQFNNVPEYNSGSTFGAIKGNGRILSQVVLSEGSNDITIYTSSMTVTNSSNFVTQGIENATGTEAKYDSVQNPLTGTWSPRVHGFFNLSNDAIRFSLISVSDKVPPSITAPANLTQGNDPGLASAVVAVGSAAAVDNCVDVNVSSVRSDGAAIDAPYPVGVTTITWTATDAAGNTASATQSVTVLDVEPPVFPTSTRSLAQSVLTFDATSPSGVAVTYQVNATDNVGVTSLVCMPPSGSVFPIGSSTVTCKASDAAGNSSSKTFSVYVTSAREQLATLMSVMRGLNLPNGTLQPLINQLKAADGDVLSCKKISDFTDLVAKKESNISPWDVVSLTDMANTISGAMGCLGNSTPTSSLKRITS